MFAYGVAGAPPVRMAVPWEWPAVNRSRREREPPAARDSPRWWDLGRVDGERALRRVCAAPAPAGTRAGAAGTGVLGGPGGRHRRAGWPGPAVRSRVSVA